MHEEESHQTASAGDSGTAYRELACSRDRGIGFFQLYLFAPRSLAVRGKDAYSLAGIPIPEWQARIRSIRGYARCGGLPQCSRRSTRARSGANAESPPAFFSVPAVQPQVMQLICRCVTN